MTIKNLFKVLPFLAGALALSTTFTSNVESQTITGSPHDFSLQAWTAEICNVCHTPHNAAPNGSNLTVPLWNRAANGTTNSAFTVFSSPTLDSTPDATLGASQRISRACLSCHDGTVNIDAYGSNAGTVTITGFIPATTANLGTDLSTSHPVAMTYDPALATLDGELYDPENTVSGLGSNIDADMLFGVANDQVECASCHDVHDETIPFFLRVDNVNSDLCLTCHIK